MPAKKSLKARITAQRDRVRETMKWRDEAKRRLDASREAKEKAQKAGDKKKARSEDAEMERRLKALEDLRDRLDKERERLIALKDGRDDRRRKRRERFSISPGSPTWGGSETIIQREVNPLIKKLRGVDRTSGKRTATFGNPGSDHHVSQTRASAGDYPLSNDTQARDAVARHLTGRTAADFAPLFFDYEDHEYRLQGIAQTHGTGPHLHVGVELVG